MLCSSWVLVAEGDFDVPTWAADVSSRKGGGDTNHSTEYSLLLRLANLSKKRRPTLRLEEAREYIREGKRASFGLFLMPSLPVC